MFLSLGLSRQPCWKFYISLDFKWSAFFLAQRSSALIVIDNFCWLVGGKVLKEKLSWSKPAIPTVWFFIVLFNYESVYIFEEKGS